MRVILIKSLHEEPRLLEVHEYSDEVLVPVPMPLKIAYLTNALTEPLRTAVEVYKPWFVIGHIRLFRYDYTRMS